MVDSKSRPWEVMVAGALQGVVGVLVGYPFDTIKVYARPPYSVATLT